MVPIRVEFLRVCEGARGKEDAWGEPGRIAGNDQTDLALAAGALVAVTAVFFATLIGHWTATAPSRKRRAARAGRTGRNRHRAEKVVPVRLEALGNVTTIASVAIKSRVESVITAVHFADGAAVKEGDLLFTLDGRQIEADLNACRR